MPAFLVTLPETARFTLPEGVTNMVVFAADAADAKALAQSEFSGDSNPAWDAATATQITADTDFSDSAWRLRVSILDSSPVVDVSSEGGVSGVDTSAVNAGGAAYVAGDVVTVAGGTFSRAATLRVTTVSTGAITGLELVDPGEYTVDPTLTANAVTGGTGNSATVDLTMSTDNYANFWSEVVGALNATSVITSAAIDFGEAGVGATDLLCTIADTVDSLGDKQVSVEFSRNGVAIPTLVGTITDEGVIGDALTVVVEPATVEAPKVTSTLRE